MSTCTSCSNMTIDEILAEAIDRERSLRDFYNQVITDVGPDAQLLMARLHVQHDEQMCLLGTLLKEIQDLRELSVGMAD